MDKKVYREVLGKRLRTLREDRGITVDQVAQLGNLPVDLVEVIESGTTDYTIDAFLSYIVGSDLYMFFSEKSEDRIKPHDFNDLAEMAVKNDPEK